MGSAADNETTEDGPLQIVSVRGRPVGVSRSRFGASLVAVERGYFPLSPTGYWSLSGYGMGQPGPLAISPEHLESLAESQDRERKALLVNLHRAVKPERDRKGNFIHVSLYVDKAINDGFFSPDHERAPLWQAAHRLLCLVDSGCGVDHYYATRNRAKEACINLDQDFVTIAVNDETLFQGEIGELPAQFVMQG